jgi:hypothetical protein
MTNRRSGFLILSGAIVAGLAVWSIAAGAQQRALDLANGSPPPAQTVEVADVPTVATTVIHVATPPPEITGITVEIARVLAARGFAQNAAESDVAAELPESVARVLVTEGVTLAVADTPPGGAP